MSKKDSIEGIRVQLKYLSTIRDKTERRLEEVSFPHGSRLQEVAVWLTQKYDVDLSDHTVMATLNGRGWNQFPEKLDTKIRTGDVIIIFPLVSGG